ncbi:hypothetical protein TNCV_4547331 [Trichonephila clavipes]|nr:hypothetical protein TNCV_4547331 [Trichonephila clavipes]
MIENWVASSESLRTTVVDIHQLDSIGKETRQTRHRVSSHQQSNVSVDGHRPWIGSLASRVDPPVTFECNIYSSSNSKVCGLHLPRCWVLLVS